MNAQVLPFVDTVPLEPSELEAALATVNAALAVLDDRDDLACWAEALRRLRPAVPWCRVVLLAEGTWQMHAAASALEPVEPRDPAVYLAARVTTDDARWFEAGVDARMPTGLGGALVARRESTTLVFELPRHLGPPNPMVGALVLESLRLLVALGCFRARRGGPPVHGLVGDSPAMQAVFDLVRRHADSHAAVYVYGESGTGKERVARALHEGSARRARPFVAVNASGLPDELFESQVFGHRRGAFTGAVNDHEGYVGQAEGGTLFIDEIADLSPRGQAKLLRFLESNDYRRVGDTVDRKADVRVVCASNALLADRVAAQAFREDLLYRVQVLTVELPPLRERPGDVVQIGQHLLGEIARAEGKASPRVGELAWRALEAYPWPGNVRELKGEMYRLVVERAGAFVGPRDLAPHIRELRQRPMQPIRAATDAFQRRLIQRTLAECVGGRADAARRLGLSRPGLMKMMSRLGLDWPPVPRSTRDAGRARRPRPPQSRAGG